MSEYFWIRQKRASEWEPAVKHDEDCWAIFGVEVLLTRDEIFEVGKRIVREVVKEDA